MSEKDWFVAAALLLVLLAFGGLGMMGLGFGTMMGGGFSIIWLLVLAGILWVVFKDKQAPPQDEAQGILKRRLARGEISMKEYDRLQKVIDHE